MDDSANMNLLRADFVSALNNLSTGTYKSSGDIFDFTLWDNFPLSATVNSHTMFQAGQGTTDPNTGNIKTLTDTNLPGSNGIPQGWKLFVKCIKLFIVPTAVLTDANLVKLYQFVANTVAQFKVIGKDQMGQWLFLELMNLPLPIAATATAAGYPTTQIKGFGMLPLNLPLVLASNVRFNVQIDQSAASDAALNGTRVWFGLNGILERLS